MDGVFLYCYFFHPLCRIQPVYVVDVAAAIVAALKDDGASMGKIYELGGPEVFTVHELVISHPFVSIFLLVAIRTILLSSECNAGRAYVRSDP